MTGQRHPVGWAVLVGVLCAVVLFGLSFARGTTAMTGVAHSERGPSSASFVTSTTVAAPSSEPDPTDVALPASSPRGSSRGLAVAPPVQVPVTPAVVAPAVASGVVRQGAFCARDAVGQTGYTSSGTTMICTYADGEDQPRWRADGPSEQDDQEQQDDQQDQEEQHESTTATATTTSKAPSGPQAENLTPFRPDS
jgi:hypothetical protein